ncbi:MAG TPA: hypothetical protein PK308_09100 [Phycisphaerales bacterium]|nr:hypothetical protein [Phycisphaerales bacterium]
MTVRVHDLRAHVALWLFSALAAIGITLHDDFRSVAPAIGFLGLRLLASLGGEPVHAENDATIVKRMGSGMQSALIFAAVGGVYWALSLPAPRAIAVSICALALMLEAAMGGSALPRRTTELRVG